MSAYVVEKAVIDVLVAAAVSAGLVPAGGEDAAGQMLLDECVKSVAYRYPRDGDNERPGCYDVWDCPAEERVGQWQTPYVYRQPTGGLVGGWADVSKGEDPVQVAAQEYDYQSCEHPGWRSSGACKLVDQLRQQAAVA